MTVTMGNPKLYSFMLGVQSGKTTAEIWLYFTTSVVDLIELSKDLTHQIPTHSAGPTLAATLYSWISASDQSLNVFDM